MRVACEGGPAAWLAQVSPIKAQLSLPEVTYLGALLTSAKRHITTDRKSLISVLPLPTSKTEILAFLGVAGSCDSSLPSPSLLQLQPLLVGAPGLNPDRKSVV